MSGVWLPICQSECLSGELDYVQLPICQSECLSVELDYVWLPICPSECLSVELDYVGSPICQSEFSVCQASRARLCPGYLSISQNGCLSS